MLMTMIKLDYEWVIAILWELEFLDLFCFVVCVRLGCVPFIYRYMYLYVGMCTFVLYVRLVIDCWIWIIGWVGVEGGCGRIS